MVCPKRYCTPISYCSTPPVLHKTIFRCVSCDFGNFKGQQLVFARCVLHRPLVFTAVLFLEYIWRSWMLPVLAGVNLDTRATKIFQPNTLDYTETIRTTHLSLRCSRCRGERTTWVLWIFRWSRRRHRWTIALCSSRTPQGVGCPGFICRRPGRRPDYRSNSKFVWAGRCYMPGYLRGD